MKFKTIEWKRDRVRLIDQRRLPGEVRYLDCKDPPSLARAIRSMAIRGAPAIGVAASMGIALAAQKLQTRNLQVFLGSVRKVCQQMKQTRPTAVNLFWAVSRMERLLDQARSLSTKEIKVMIENEALRIYKEDLQINRKIGENGRKLIKDGDGVLTHCNAGGLATAGFGTALGVIQAAWAEGKRFHVFVDETRPLLQGSRLTAWELAQEKIPATVLTDNMAGWLMKNRKISLVIVGADRIARNGDTANKIGTYGLAILAKYHGVPFYVAAPTSTLDWSLASGEKIPIEERSSEEVTHLGRKRITPKGVKAYNPAFDVTPHSLIHGIITEKGIAREPFEKNLKKINDERREGSKH
jgi:methylthioribose-1-phosphate isomerase